MAAATLAILQQTILEEIDIGTCAICLEELGDDDCRLCSSQRHGFHDACLQEWATSAARAGQPATCPVCRVDIEAGILNAMGVSPSRVRRLPHGENYWLVVQQQRQNQAQHKKMFSLIIFSVNLMFIFGWLSYMDTDATLYISGAAVTFMAACATLLRRRVLAASSLAMILFVIIAYSMCVSGRVAPTGVCAAPPSNSLYFLDIMIVWYTFVALTSRS